MRIIRLLSIFLATIMLAGCGAKPDSATLHIQKAQALIDAGKTKQAIVEIDRAIADTSRKSPRPTNREMGELYLYKGHAQWKVRRIAEARGSFEKALSLMPDDPSVLNDTGYFYADENINLRQALRLTMKALKLQPGDPVIIDSVGWAQYKLGKIDDAARNLKRSVELAPGSAELRYHLGAIYVKSGKRFAAEIELSKAISLDINHKQAQKLLAQMSSKNKSGCKTTL